MSGLSPKEYVDRVWLSLLLHAVDLGQITCDHAFGCGYLGNDLSIGNGRDGELSVMRGESGRIARNGPIDKGVSETLVKRISFSYQ